MRHVSFNNLKAKFERENKKDREFRAIIGALIDTSKLKAYSRSKRGVMLVAGNKAYAQELFLKRESLQHTFACEVVIQ